MLKLVILMTRGLIADTRSRRWAMFVLLLAAMVMLFAGATFLTGALARPVPFLIYWGACAWLTLAALLLAIWDMLMIRIAARHARRKLEKEMIAREERDDDE